MNTRATMPSAMPADRAEVLSDNARELARSERLQIEDLSNELIAARLADGELFHALMDGIDPSSLNPYLHIAMMHDSNAYSGDPIAAAQLVTAMHQFFNVVRAEAKTIWRDECVIEAERELP